MNTYTTETTKNWTEQELLIELEVVIAKGQKAFYEIGSALRTIREQKLDQVQGYNDFETYCRDKWDMTRRHADQLIKAAECKEILTQNNCSQLPANEAQIRALTKLPPEKQAEVWQKIIQETPDGKITAKKVKEFVEQEQRKEEPITEKILVTKEAKRIHKALSVLSEYEAGKIREAIFSASGEVLNMPQLATQIRLNFSHLEL